MRMAQCVHTTVCATHVQRVPFNACETPPRRSSLLLARYHASWVPSAQPSAHKYFMLAYMRVALPLYAAPSLARYSRNPSSTRTPPSMRTMMCTTTSVHIHQSMHVNMRVHLTSHTLSPVPSNYLIFILEPFSILNLTVENTVRLPLSLIVRRTVAETVVRWW